MLHELLFRFALGCISRIAFIVEISAMQMIAYQSLGTSIGTMRHYALMLPIAIFPLDLALQLLL